jgi:hypothetical protein
MNPNPRKHKKKRKEKKKCKGYTHLEKSGGIADVVPDGALSGDSDLVFVYRRFGLRLFDPLVPIHGLNSDFGTFTRNPCP